MGKEKVIITIDEYNNLLAIHNHILPLYYMGGNSVLKFSRIETGLYYPKTICSVKSSDKSINDIIKKIETLNHELLKKGNIICNIRAKYSSPLWQCPQKRFWQITPIKNPIK